MMISPYYPAPGMAAANFSLDPGINDIKENVLNLNNHLLLLTIFFL